MSTFSPVTVRVLVLSPLPHETLHGLHGLHGPTSPADQVQTIKLLEICILNIMNTQMYRPRRCSHKDSLIVVSLLHVVNKESKRKLTKVDIYT